MMLTDDLEWFVMLAETQHVTATSDMTRISQPTLSRKLARLEKQIGVPLFDRHGRRLTLNAYGRILYDHAKPALRSLTAAQNYIEALAGPNGGTVRLDFLHSFGTWLIPRMLRNYRADHPGVHFELHQDAAALLGERVACGRSDLAVVSPEPRSAHLSWAPIAVQTLALAVPSDHRFATAATIDLIDAADESFIGMHENFGMRRILDELCATAGFTPRLVFESSELATIGGLVSAGLGVAVMPVQVPPLWPDGVVHVPITGATRAIGLVWPTNRTLSVPAEQFRAFASTTEWT
ncbi:LysR family transcriptional activator of glutamate synthase operon [Rhodococcus sp. 27YEA15]|uniref:LysR family transcriptional regulator n=1 Tax=Rhodococcus sp. 27YEA15 TaxID=3156259 RepID=UPI003C7BFB51